MALYIPRLLLLSIATFSLLYPNCIHAVKTKQAKKRVPPTQQQRFALIVAPAGNTSRHYMWLQDEDPIQGRNWDLALLYYGDNENFTCKECIAVWRGQGAKWNVIHRFLLEDPRFHNISQNYAAVTFMDDDLQITASVLNTFFEVFVAFDLTIAQPSCCMGSYSYWQAVTAQRDARVLHYTSFVELMAPTISAPFFDSIVRSTLEEAYTGWGLDFVWPYLAGWPTNKIAVVDAVCMLHGGQAPRKRVYESGLPMSPWEEWDRQLAKYNLTEHVVAEAGMQWKVPSEFGELLTNETKIPKILWKDVVDKIRGKEVSGIQQQSSMALLESITPVTWLAVACIVGVSLAFSRGAVVGVRSRLRHQYLRLRQHLAQQNSD